jgi:hypothetical protein
MHDIEAELVKALKFKKKYDDRQEYLEAILVAIDDRDRFTDDDYDNLSDEAAAWHKAAVAAKDAHDEIPEFDDELEDETSDDTDHEADEAAEEVADADEESDTESDDGDEADEAEDESEAPEEDDADATGDDEAEPVDDDEPSEESSGSSAHESNGAEASTDTEADEDEEPAPPKAKKQVKAVPKQAKPKAVKEKKKGPVGGTFGDPDYSKITGDKDRFGVTMGTKTAEAVKMYVKGASRSQIMERFGADQKNILTRLAKSGHKVEKSGEGVWKLTHKEDIHSKRKVK